MIFSEKKKKVFHKISRFDLKKEFTDNDVSPVKALDVALLILTCNSPLFNR
jgi:hypothetical protein